MEVRCETFRRRMLVMMTSLVFILSYLLDDSLVLACTCLPKHPQQHYCDSDYAIRVKIVSQRLKLPNGRRYEVDDPAISDIQVEVLSQSRREWTAELQRVFRGYDKLKHATTVRLYTPFYETMCGVGTLKNDEVYAIMGTFGHGGLNFNYCDWHHEWKSVTSRQRRGLRYWYAENCGCQIETCGLQHPCSKTKAEVTPSSCEWDAWHSRCTNQHTACVMTSQGCQWHQSKDLKKCINAP